MAPVLVSRNYSNDFQIFSFASEETIFVVLLHKNKEEHENLIAFFIIALLDAELKYDILEKEVYALVKALKAFKFYVL